MKKQKNKPADKIQDLQFFGEFGGVNPSIADSSTFTYLAGKTMEDVFDGSLKGCYLYSRHTNPSTSYLGKALAELEYTNGAILLSSGMAAITTTLLQLCNAGDEIISSRTIYGGSYAFMKNYLPKFNIKTTFVDTTSLIQIERAITKNTKVIYCETMSNPLLEIADINAISKIAKKYDLFNDIITFGMHRKWKRFVAQQTDLDDKQNCLDLWEMLWPCILNKIVQIRMVASKTTFEY